MSEPDDIIPGHPVTRDAGALLGVDPYLVEISWESETTWITKRFPIASGVVTARITRTDDPREPWSVHPFDPDWHDGTYETWEAAVAGAMTVPVPPAR